MCGGLHARPVLPTFVHVVRPVVEDMPELVPFSGEEIECAFPQLFEFLTAIMFLDPRGYGEPLDDEQRSSPGSWYGLSWGCIHRDTLTHWKPYARNVRRDFWNRCWRWMVTFGKEPLVEPGYGREVLLAFVDPLPIPLFAKAVERLIEQGMLEQRTEEHADSGQTIVVYYPTRAMADRLYNARRSRAS